MLVPVLHSWNMSFVARNQTSVSRINLVTRPCAVQRCVVERKRGIVHSFGELIAVGEVAQCTLSLDLTRVTELGVGEEPIAGIS